MNKVRVILANRPRMLRESLEGILSRHPDIEVVAVEPDPIEMLTAVERVEADAVVISLADGGTDPGIMSHLFAEFPDLLIIAVSPEKPEAFVYRQVITKEALKPLSESSLLSAILGRLAERPGSSKRPFNNTVIQ